MGVNINYALYDIEFDEDLYSYKGFGCPLVDSFKNVIQFSNQDNGCYCDFTLNNTNTHTSPNDPLCSNNCRQSKKDSLIKEWNVLEISGGSKTYVGINDETNFRFLNIKKDLGFTIKISPIKGSFIADFHDSNYLGDEPAIYRFNSLDDEILISICPNNVLLYTSGTYYINIVPFTSNISFTIDLQYMNIPISIENDTFINNCNEMLPNVTCLNLGEIYEIDSSGLFTFQIIDPGYYVINVHSDDSSVFISDDPLIIDPNEENSKWYIKNYGNTNNMNSKTIFFEKPTNLYIKVLCSGNQCLNYVKLYIVKSQGLNIKRISSMSQLEGSLALVSSSRIKFKDRYYNCQKFSSCNPFSILYPTNDITPLWPVPGALQFIPSFDYRYMDNNNQIEIKEKSYQIAIILSINYGKGIIEYLNLNDAIKSIEIEFVSTIFDINGDPLNFKVLKFNYNNINICNYNQFEDSLNQINNNDVTSNIKQINNWKYEISLLQSLDNWIGCENKAFSFLKFENIKYNTTSYQCPYSSTDPRYNLDACCNYHLLFSEACREKNVEFQSLKIQDYQNTQIVDQCFNLDCTSIVLNQFVTGKYYNGQDECKISNLDILNTHLSTYNSLRECRKKVLEPPSCNNDNDCSIFSDSTTKCDLFTRRCIVNYQVTDKKYINCVLNQIPLGTLYSYISTLNIDSVIIDSIYNRSLYKDWSIQGSNPMHSTFTYSMPSLNSEAAITNNLIDSSNEITFTNLHEIYGWTFEKDDYYLLLENQEKLNCNAYFLMLPKGYEPQVYSSYSYKCDSPSLINPTVHSFCGYCTDYESDDSYCHIYNGSLVHDGLNDYYEYPFSPIDATINQTQCNLGLSMCLLKDGVSIPSITKNQCENNMGSCSVPCSYQCEGTIEKCIWITFNSDQGVDYITMDQTICESSNFTWESNEYTDMCITNNNNEQDCIGQGYLWLDCPSKEIDNCIGPNFNLIQGDSQRYFDNYRNLCKLKEIPCTSKQECLNRGKCSDYSFFYDQESKDDIYPYPNGLAKCVHNHTVDTKYGKSCKQDEEYDSPSGCFTMLNIPGKEICTLKGSQYKLWKAATNKEECLSQMGCKTIDYVYNDNIENLNPNNLPYSWKFNDMNKDNCEAQYLSGNQWTNKFSWQEAIWYPGIHVSSIWYENKTFTNRYKYQEVFDYQAFYNELIEATEKQVSVLYSSESNCKYEKSVKFLNSVLCSCNGNGSPDCFKSTNQILSQSIKCNGDNSTTISFKNGLLLFDDNSILQGCEMITVSQVYRSTYSISSPQPLSNNFISYIKPDNYAVLNQNGAVIGTILDDGIILKSDLFGISQVILCFNIGQQQDQSKYPILDFAILDKYSNKLYPMNTIPILMNEKVNDGTDYNYCSLVGNFSTIETIYPMNRISYWQEKEKEFLDKKTTTLVYILACLFALVGIYGFVQTIEFIIKKFKKSTPFQLTHLLISSVSTFIIIRGVYFFLLPRGSLTDIPASDYVLVVLPTFIYLSSFSIIIALWYIIVFLVLRFNPAAGNMKARLNAVVGSINAIIYLFFIAIVIVFHYSPFIPNTDCTSLVFEEMKNSTSQEVVSIVYSVVQALLSLLIGISFIYLGDSIIRAMKRNNLTGGIYSNNTRKIKILAIVCSIGFILHSIFIILISVKAVS